MMLGCLSALASRARCSSPPRWPHSTQHVLAVAHARRVTKCEARIPPLVSRAHSLCSPRTTPSSPATQFSRSPAGTSRSRSSARTLRAVQPARRLPRALRSTSSHTGLPAHPAELGLGLLALLADHLLGGLVVVVPTLWSVFMRTGPMFISVALRSSESVGGSSSRPFRPRLAEACGPPAATAPEDRQTSATSSRKVCSSCEAAGRCSQHLSPSPR